MGPHYRGRRDFTAQGPCKNRIKKQLLLLRVATRSSKKHQTQSRGLRRGPTSIYRFPEKIKVWKRGGGDRETSSCLSTHPFLFVEPRKEATPRTPYLTSGRQPRGFSQDRKLSLCVSRAPRDLMGVVVHFCGKCSSKTRVQA